jgi:hypothetical protein
MPIKPKQTCMTCPNLVKCWATHTNSGNAISVQNVLINNQICRLQLGIDRDQVAANLIKLYKPGMIRILSYAKQTGSMVGSDMDQILQDMQSTMIEYLLYDYKIGDRGRATPYLFDPHQGFLVKWAKWALGKQRKFYSHHELHSSNVSNDDDIVHDDSYRSQHSTQNGGSNSWESIMEGSDSVRFDPFVVDEISSLAKEVVDIIDDGITLNSNEYRVMKFCLSNANEANSSRHIDGLHIYLAKLMGVSRPRITRLYSRAKDKIRNQHIRLEEQV